MGKSGPGAKNGKKTKRGRKRKSTRKETYKWLKDSGRNTDEARIKLKVRIQNMLDLYVDELKECLEESLNSTGGTEEQKQRYRDFFNENLFVKLQSPQNSYGLKEALESLDNNKKHEQWVPVKNENALVGAELLIKSKCKANPEKVKSDFDKKKADGTMYADFKKIGGLNWPECNEIVYSHRGKKIRKKGAKYDGHHGFPKGMGGENYVWNLLPVPPLRHYDSQGIHSPKSPYKHLNEMVNKYCSLWED